MKKNTVYFTIGCIALVFLVGIFIYIAAASTYSVYDVTNVSIDDISVPVNGTKTIGVSFEFLNNAMTTEETDKYHLQWEVNSSNVSLGSATTTLRNANNSITALGLDDGAVVTVSLYYDGDDNPIATDNASIDIFSVAYVTFTNVSDTTSFSINISNNSMRMDLPNEYYSMSYHIGWSSSSEDILIVNSGGYVTPISLGIATVTANVYDDEDNIVAIASQPISVVSDNGNLGEDTNFNNVGDDTSGEGESDDYSLTSVSIDGGSNIIEGNKMSYVVSIENVTTFRISAIAKNGGTIKIKNDDDGSIYDNNETILWKVGSPNMVLYVCVVDDNDECLSNNYIYQIVLEKSGNSTIDSEGYLESLSIDSDVIIRDGVVLANYSVNCDDSGDTVLCKVEYTAKEGTTEVNIDVKARSKYEIVSSLSSPMIVSPGENGEYIEIIESGDTSKVVRCLYEINIIVPEGIGESKPDTSSSTSQNAGSNPGTADMSSFIIFMVMLSSLIASLFVYKKNVGNN